MDKRTNDWVLKKAGTDEDGWRYKVYLYFS